MKQFSLNEYLKKPRKLITRDGKNVRIICTDKDKSSYSIVALIQEDYGEVVCCYTPEGQHKRGFLSAEDLFFAPEKKDGWINLYQTDNVLPNLGSLYDTKEKALENRLQTPKCISTVKIEWEE